MSRVCCYVDGFNVYHAIDALGRPELKWLSLMALAKSFLGKIDSMISVTYFTAAMRWNPEKAQRHREYIAALAASGVEVIESRFQKSGNIVRPTIDTATSTRKSKPTSRSPFGS